MPASTVTWDLIRGEFPSFGARYEDVTRAGATAHTFLYQGSRGDRVQVECRHYFDSETAATGFITDTEALQGNNVHIADTLNNRSTVAFLHAVRFQPVKRVGSSNGNDWAAIGIMEIQRTV
jgi:hypothetical protein